MTKFRIAPAAVAAVATAALVAGSALAGTPTRSGKTIAFSASYSGKAVVKQQDTKVTISASGTGTGTLIGASKIAGTGNGDTSAQPCPVWLGTGAITGAGGAKIKFAVQTGSKACVGSDKNQVSISGKATVGGGGGKFAKAKGTLTFTGKLDRAKGAFSVKFTGTLTV